MTGNARQSTREMPANDAISILWQLARRPRPDLEFVLQTPVIRRVVGQQKMQMGEKSVINIFLLCCAWPGAALAARLYSSPSSALNFLLYCSVDNDRRELSRVRNR